MYENIVKFAFMSAKLVIIPTYNEKENAEKIIRAVFALEGGFHILESMTVPRTEQPE